MSLNELFSFRIWENRDVKCSIFCIWNPVKTLACTQLKTGFWFLGLHSILLNMFPVPKHWPICSFLLFFVTKVLAEKRFIAVWLAYMIYIIFLARVRGSVPLMHWLVFQLWKALLDNAGVYKWCKKLFCWVAEFSEIRGLKWPS